MRGGSERGLSVRARQWFSGAVLRKPLLVRSTADPLRAYNEESERRKSLRAFFISEEDEVVCNPERGYWYNEESER